MATSFEVATDEIYGRLKEAWDAGAEAAVGNPDVLLLYEDTEWKGRPDDESRKTPWGRVTIRHNAGEQATLADSSGKALFRNYGMVTVQVFAPMRDNTGPMVSRRLAQVVKNAFQGKRTTNVWFRQVTYTEVGREGAWYQINVTANFEWDEVTQ